MESILRQIYNRIPPPDWTWAVSALVAATAFYIARFIYVLRMYPRGPFPLPIVGNLLKLKCKKTFSELASEWSKKYQDPVTVWVGPKPLVLVNTWELAKEANVVKRNDFAGRIQTKMGDLQQQGHHDILFSDYGATWEALRKVAHTAVRKYAISEELEKLCAEVTEEYVNSIKDGQPVQLKQIMFSIINIIIAQSAFGVKFKEDDPDFITLRDVNEKFLKTAPNGLPSDMIPILGVLYWRLEKKIHKIFEEILEVINRYYENGKKQYKSGVIKHFTDAVLAAREEAVAEEKNTAEHFTDGNLGQIIVDLFGAGTDTSLNTLQWIFLFISNEPQYQEKLYKEIQENIGDRPPTNADRKKMPFAMACIYETLRLRPVAPLGLPHKAIHDAELGGIKIPKDTAVFFNIEAINKDPKYWDEPLEYKPERWISQDGSFTNERLQSFMPFGIGRRSCLGEKLALADMFYVMVRLLQLAKFSLKTGPGSADFDNSTSSLFSFPVNQQVILTKRK